MTTASLWKPAWYAGGKCIASSFHSLPVISVTVEEVTWACACTLLALLLGYNWVAVWNFRSPVLWLYLCIIQISLSKWSLKIIFKNSCVICKMLNTLILHLFNVMVFLTLLSLLCYKDLFTNFSFSSHNFK